MVDLEYTVEEPLNREPALRELVGSFITDAKTAYDRNHGPIPTIPSPTHTLTLAGRLPHPLTLTPHTLRTTFPQHTLTCALQCAGNRRHTMRTLLREVSGIDWCDGAVMNCVWSGPLLSDVLARAGVVQDIPDGGGHVQFECRQTACQDDGYYGSSIPLSRCLDPEKEVILALDMNGAPLPAAHGAPVRLMAPGIAGARAVKWLDRIVVAREESGNFYQQRDYKILPAEADSKEKAREWWSKCEAIQGMPVNSVVCVPVTGGTVEVGERGEVEVVGYALPGGDDGPVVRVEVSGDEGRTWVDATLEGDKLSKWAWTLWRARVKVEVGEGRRIVSRATDRGGNMQPEMAEWNFRGVAYNGWGEARDLNVVVGEAEKPAVSGVVNGMVNGFGKLSLNGKSNGAVGIDGVGKKMPNGYVNGDLNGYANGHVNGFGKTNGVITNGSAH